MTSNIEDGQEAGASFHFDAEMLTDITRLVADAIDELEAGPYKCFVSCYFVHSHKSLLDAINRSLWQ